MPMTPPTDGAKAGIMRLAAAKLVDNLKAQGLGQAPVLTMIEFAEMPSIVLAMFYDLIASTVPKEG